MLCLSSDKDGPCRDQAAFVVYWPGKTTYSCGRHASGQKRIADAMGMGLDVMEIKIKDGAAVVPLPPELQP
jgi:hypothetical protein